MNTIFTEYLLKNNWVKVNSMSYALIDNELFEVYFDSSNQVEFYYDKKRIDEKYLLSIDDLVSFLNENLPAPPDL